MARASSTRAEGGAAFGGNVYEMILERRNIVYHFPFPNWFFLPSNARTTTHIHGQAHTERPAIQRRAVGYTPQGAQGHTGRQAIRRGTIESVFLRPCFFCEQSIRRIFVDYGVPQEWVYYYLPLPRKINVIPYHFT